MKQKFHHGKKAHEGRDILSFIRSRPKKGATPLEIVELAGDYEAIQGFKIHGGISPWFFRTLGRLLNENLVQYDEKKKKYFYVREKSRLVMEILTS